MIKYESVLFKRLWQIPIFIFFFQLSINASAANFESDFRQRISDGTLDRNDFYHLQKLSLQINDAEEYHFAQNLIVLLSQYSSFIQLNFGYVYQQQQRNVTFFFSPHFAEQDPIPGFTTIDVFSKVSQQDTLKQTTADSQRCGAAALLAAYYHLNGNLNLAFSRLQIPGSHFNYLRVHLAQEKLYHLANTDKKEGLTQKVVYQVDSNGRIKIIQHDGEIEVAARRIGLKISPLKITEKVELLDRQKLILNLWKKSPKIPLLVGVHLDIHSGEIWPPNQSNHPENHFVLVFRHGNKVWLYNSGVINNGIDEAIIELSAENLKQLVTQTPGSVNLVTKQ